MKAAKELKIPSIINVKAMTRGLFCTVAVVAFVCSVILGGMRLAYSIKYDNKVITTVSDTKVYYAAVDMVAQIVQCENVEDVLPEAEIVPIVTLDKDFDSCDKVADAIIDNTDEIISASRLVVGGETLACADTDMLRAALEARRVSFDLDGEDCESSFVDDVRLEEDYFVLSDVSDISEVRLIISNLAVKTVARITTLEEVDYNIVLEEDPDEEVGYNYVRQQGEKGINSITTGIVYINGEKTEEVVTAFETLKEPVDEIAVAGTKKNESKAVKFDSGFSFPLPSGVWELSCPYGKDGHKGVDLRAPRNTPISAAASGKVIEAKYKGSYGNCVVIDHGNGIKTLYAHASTLCVSEGDYVSAGDVISLVGSTGNSTGYHLHFEIYVGDKRVNPQKYIGL